MAKAKKAVNKNSKKVANTTPAVTKKTVAKKTNNNVTATKKVLRKW